MSPGRSAERREEGAELELMGSRGKEEIEFKEEGESAGGRGELRKKKKKEEGRRRRKGLGWVVRTENKRKRKKKEGRRGRVGPDGPDQKK